jgi:hypothetical protein
MEYKTLKQGNYWVVNKAVAKIIGIEAALFLSDIIDKYDYHKERNECLIKNNKCYFYYTSADIEENTTLNYNSQKKCIKILEGHGLIESKLIGTPAKLHFTILENKFCDFLKTCIAENEKLYNKNKDIIIEDNTSSADANLFADKDNADDKDTVHTPPRNNVVTKVTPEEFVEMYHKRCPVLPKVSKLTQKRKDAIGRRVKEMGDRETIESILDRLNKSDFCRGVNQNKWKADLDWLVKNDTIWVWILEGKYDNKQVETFTPVFNPPAQVSTTEITDF